MICGAVQCKFLVTTLQCSVTNKKYMRAVDTKFCICDNINLSLLFLLDTKFNLNKDILSHNNVPLEKPKCTPRGTCTPVWKPLC